MNKNEKKNINACCFHLNSRVFSGRIFSGPLFRQMYDLTSGDNPKENTMQYKKGKLFTQNSFELYLFFVTSSYFSRRVGRG